jgi:hypothetical protein
MDGRASRLTLLGSILYLGTLSAHAESVFGISELNESRLHHRCYAIEQDKKIITPAHCLNTNNRLFLTSLTNPIIGVPITKTYLYQNKDLASVEADLSKLPPKGENAQGVYWCSSAPSLQPEVVLHDCTSLKEGDSGSLIISNKAYSMHLGIIYFSGKPSGFSLKYQSIIKNNSDD